MTAGTPASAKVGTSGSCGTRRAPLTASATAVPYGSPERGGPRTMKTIGPTATIGRQ